MNRTQRIAIWLATLVIMLALWKVFGQGFGNFRSDQPFLARNYPVSSGEPYATNIILGYSNIYRWWVAQDVPTNHVISNQWVDRIVGAPMAQMNASVQPTNSASGIALFSGKYLTNAPLILGSSRALFLFVTQVDLNGQYQQLWFEENDDADLGYLTWNDANQFNMVTPPTIPGQVTPTWPDNVMLDWLMHGMSIFTNSVLMFDYNNSLSASKYKYLGSSYDGSANLRCYIREIIIWTNCETYSGMSYPLSATIRSNLHYYATNRYPEITP